MPYPAHRPSLISALSYKDPRAALHWLEAAFGFEQAMVIVDGEDKVVHAEMNYGDGLIMVGTEWSERNRSPVSLDGKTTQTVHVAIADDIDGHCEQARQAGARIDQEPATQFYGDRTYRCTDPEGHIWTFGQKVKAMTPQEWDRDTGLTTKLRI